MRAAHLRPSSRLSAFLLFCLLAMSPMFAVKSNATTLSITGVPPSGTVGVTYAAFPLGVSGGTAPYYWTISVGAPPPGLVLGTATISGKPTTSGTYSFTVKVTDSSAVQNVGTAAMSITINPSPTLSLSLPATISFPNPTVGQPYSAHLAASGGSLPSYLWTVNGTPIPTNGGSVTLPGGLQFLSTSGPDLNIGGTPTVAGLVTFTLQVTNVACLSGCSQTGPTATATYAINIVKPSYTVNGQIFLNNNCGGSSTLPPMKLSINTNPVRTTTTNSNGNFSFTGLSNGTYTITPSITGASSVFYPATQSVTVNGNNVYTSFSAALGYTVSGTVNYSGTKTGRIYLVLNSNNCGGNPLGTSISAKGSFTIHGVPPGSYTAQAWMDTLGFESPNAADPAGSDSNLTVSAANLTGVAVTLSNPAAVTLPSAPTLQMVSPFAGGALVQFKALQSNTSNNNNNGNGMELATSYTLEWSTTSSFTAVTGSHTYAATGANGNNIWLLKGLTEGAIYYFRVQGSAGTSTSPWSTPIGPFTIAAPKAANTVSGTVTFTGTATGPLYVGFYDSKTNHVYATAITAPVSPQAYTVEVPTGSNYQFFGIIDQNNDDIVDAGDISNVNGNNGPPAAVITASKTGENLTLASANSSVSLATQHGRQTNQSGTYDWYNLNFNVNGLTKLPVAVTLESGPNLITPMDIGQCNCNGNGGFSFWPSLANTAPKVGDTYTLLVTYSDGSTQTLTAKVGAVLSAFATKLAPAGSSSALANLKPTFTWTYPASPTLYTYQFQLSDNNGNQIWQIPGNNSNSNGFPSTVTSLVWGTDPTGGGSTPSVSSLTLGAMYNWQIQAQDANGNSSVMQVSYQPGGELPLSLPSTDPSTLGPATVGQPYSGTITATGGSPCYNWQVSGLSDNLGWGSNCNALTINGTPTTAETVSFQAKISDNQGHSYGPVTYTIHVAAPTPLSLKTTQSDVPVALINSPYDLYLNVSGGIPPYTFTTATGSVPAGFAYIPASHVLAGTPTIAGSYPFEVKVTDSALHTVTSPMLTVTVDNAPNHQHDAWLKGTYICQKSAFNDSDGSYWTALASIPFNGTSTFSGAVFDKISAATGPISGTMTGTVNIGADNTGLMSMTSTTATGSSTNLYAVTLNNVAAAPATEFHRVEIDDVGAKPSGQHSMADCYLAAPAAFTSSTIAGHSFAFGLGGVNGNNAPKSTIGQYIAGTGGLITGGEVDTGKGNNNNQNGTLTGTYTAPIATTGRYTMALTNTVNGTVNGTANFVNYIIDAKRQLMMMFNGGGDGPQSGNVRTQQQTSYSNANLNGPFVLYLHEHGFNSTTGAVDGFASNLFQGKGNGTTGFTINQSFQDKVNTLGLPGTYVPQGSNGAISVKIASNGRAAISPGAGSIDLYFYDNNSAFIMDASGGNLGLGWIEAQILPVITDTTLVGTFEWGSMFPLAPYAQDDIGHVTLAGLSSLTASASETGTTTSAQQYEFSWDGAWPAGLTYAWSSIADGTFLTSYGATPVLSCIYVNDTKSVCINDTSSVAEVDIVQK